MLSNLILILLRLTTAKPSQTMACSDQVSHAPTDHPLWPGLEMPNTLFPFPVLAASVGIPSPHHLSLHLFMALHSISLQLYPSGMGAQLESLILWHTGGIWEIWVDKSISLPKFRTQIPSKDTTHTAKSIYKLHESFQGYMSCLLSETYWEGLCCSQDGQKNSWHGERFPSGNREGRSQCSAMPTPIFLCWDKFITVPPCMLPPFLCTLCCAMLLSVPLLPCHACAPVVHCIFIPFTWVMFRLVPSCHDMLVLVFPY